MWDFVRYAEWQNTWREIKTGRSHWRSPRWETFSLTGLGGLRFLFGPARIRSANRSPLGAASASLFPGGLQAEPTPKANSLTSFYGRTRWKSRTNSECSEEKEVSRVKKYFFAETQANCLRRRRLVGKLFTHCAPRKSPAGHPRHPERRVRFRETRPISKFPANDPATACRSSSSRRG